MSGRNVLIFAAHPDDEVLGCGGTMARHVAMGDRVHTVFLADGVTARGSSADPAPFRAEIDRRQSAARAASALLGAQPPRFLSFPDNRMDALDILDIVKAVETVIAEVKPALVYTHHGGDLNIDHVLTHRAVITACRPLPGRSVRAIYAFETLSATEWSSTAIGEAFRPTCFVDISSQIDLKLRALACYGEEIPPSPHARSLEAVKALAVVRGSASGLPAAEAFQVLREIW
jgi:LmbE family N-acetylglucosaminyl deacetylase